LSDALTVVPIWKIGPAACVQRGPVFYFSTPGGKHLRICDLVSRIISKETEHEAWTIKLHRDDPDDAPFSHSARTCTYGAVERPTAYLPNELA
jgi:hypothetical protein